MMSESEEYLKETLDTLIDLGYHETAHRVLDMCQSTFPEYATYKERLNGKN